MKKYLSTLFILLFCLVFIASACAPEEQESQPPVRARATITVEPTPTATLTPVYDPCSSENLPDEVEKVHRIMREFDDTALVSGYIPREQIAPVLLDLQRIRRDAENQIVPPCLNTIKQYQLAHMNTVINSVLLLLQFQGTEEESIVLNQNIARARQEHDQYTLEFANLLGLTVIVPPTPVPVQETLSPGVTPSPAPLVVTNLGPTTVNLRAGPDLNAENMSILAIGASAVVLGRTEDSLWYQVEFPNQPEQTAWVYSSLVQLSDLTAELPVVTPTP